MAKRAALKRAQERTAKARDELEECARVLAEEPHPLSLASQMWLDRLREASEQAEEAEEELCEELQDACAPMHPSDTHSDRRTVGTRVAVGRAECPPQQGAR